MNIRAELEKRISAALTLAAGSDTPLPALVSATANESFGDYQANGVMAAAKKAKTNPRQLAAKVLENLDISDLASKVEIAGPGFINITLDPAFLAAQTTRAAGDPRGGVQLVDRPQTVVVDYSSPNLAKEMHVGHLRSSIIGDALANVLEFLGNTVIRQNHVGDWGTQFGMLLAYMDAMAKDSGGHGWDLSDLEAFYREARKKFDEDADFAQTSREYVVRLQAGEEHLTALWKTYVGISLAHCQAIYNRLGVKLGPENVRGESAYNDDLPGVVADLDAAGLLTESQGAKCVFLPEFMGRDDKPLPVIVQKTGGGYLYATTDLAALRYRVGQLHAQRILYVTDAGQGLHFSQIFAVARKAGFVGPEVSLEHVPFGVMLGEDGLKFRTRAGGTVKLVDLLDEAVERATAVVAQKNPHLSPEEHKQIAEVVGVGAVKYADLSMDRVSDYKFSWAKMLNLQGNTAPYMQYAYARVRSIFRKGELDSGDLGKAPITLLEPAELSLAKRLLAMQETLEFVSDESKPNILTSYLYDLSTAFSTFYEACPVLKAEPAIRASRLRLCDLTARVIKQGLSLLGIEVIEQM